MPRDKRINLRPAHTRELDRRGPDEHVDWMSFPLLCLSQDSQACNRQWKGDRHSGELRLADRTVLLQLRYGQRRQATDCPVVSPFKCPVLVGSRGDRREGSWRHLGVLRGDL